jgi:hypothetical protein
VFKAVRRFMLMRTAVKVAAQRGIPVLSAAARVSLQGTGREYQKPALLKLADKIPLLATGSVALSGARKTVMARLSGRAVQGGSAGPQAGPEGAGRIEGGDTGDDRTP